MNWALILITSVGIQNVGSYTQHGACIDAAKEWQTQGVKAGCVQQESPEQAIIKMKSIFSVMIKEIDKLQ